MLFDRVQRAIGSRGGRADAGGKAIESERADGKRTDVVVATRRFIARPGQVKNSGVDFCPRVDSC